MNPLNKHNFYKSLRKMLVSEFGEPEGTQIWEEAGIELDRITAENPGIDDRNGSLVVPLVALYKTLEAHGKDAERLLNAFGDERGEFFGKLVHVFTSTPGVDRLLWKNCEKIMQFMSSPGLGYKRRLMSTPPEMVGVDILSCPYHELAKELGAEKAVLAICYMDKKYMQGFRHIRYERSTAVSEGAECCDYRLRFDKGKR